MAPPTALLTIAERMEDLAHQYERAKDSRCVFTYAYAKMTRVLARELPGSGVRDPEWIVALAEAYSRRYMAGLTSYDRQTTPPGTWQQVFGILCRVRSSVLEDLVGGMAVHLIYDMPLALRDVGFAGDQHAVHIRDFERINAVLCRATDEIQATVVSRYCPALKWLDRLGRGYDELVTYHGIRVCRSVAWYNAMRLADPEAAEETLDYIGRHAVALVEQMTRPPLVSAQIFLRVARVTSSFFRRWPTRDDAGNRAVPSPAA